jgi:hypothetical protein
MRARQWAGRYRRNMIRLSKSQILNRKIRQDDIPDLGRPTWDLAREAARTGRIAEALDFMEYGQFESKKMHDSSIECIDDAVTYLAESFGEEEVARFWRKSFYPRVKDWLKSNLSVEEILQRSAENHRGHGASIDIKEDKNKYTLTLAPCGSEGALRKIRKVGTTRQAHPWSWNKTGIPYYCTHCCIAWEIIATELRGYPVRVHLVTENASDPCVQLFYKKPELIPAEYFTRFGMSKHK